jgi:two-component sensor histidine kinase
MAQCKGLPSTDGRGIEAEIRLAEANHRIANDLALLSAVLRRQAAEIVHGRGSVSRVRAGLLLTEASQRVTAIGSLHAMLAKRPQATMVDIGDHLRQVCVALLSSLAGPTSVELSQSFTTTCLVPADRVVPLTLIVTELVTNSVKYAHPTGVPGKISLTGECQADGTLVIEFADDGVGLPEGFDPALDGGFGFRLARVLARQIGATMTFKSTGLGLHVRLCLGGEPARHRGIEDPDDHTGDMQAPRKGMPSNTAWSEVLA